MAVVKPIEAEARAQFDAMNNQTSWNRAVADNKQPNNALPHDEEQYRRDLSVGEKDSVDSFLEAAKLFTSTPP